MATPKATNTVLTQDPPADQDGLWNTAQAAAYLGMQKGSLAAAIERTPYLKESIVKDKYPGLQINRTRIKPDAIRRFAEERRDSGKNRSHGMRRFSALMTNEEAPIAAKLLSERLGRDVRVEIFWKRRTDDKSDNGTSDSDQPVSTDQEPVAVEE